jgi:hypothetical protein
MADAQAAAEPALGAAAEVEPSGDVFINGQVWGKNCRVANVHVVGAARTKDYVVLREMEPVRLLIALVVFLYTALTRRCAGGGSSYIGGGEGRSVGV